MERHEGCSLESRQSEKEKLKIGGSCRYLVSAKSDGVELFWLSSGGLSKIGCHRHIQMARSLGRGPSRCRALEVTCDREGYGYSANDFAIRAGRSLEDYREC